MRGADLGSVWRWWTRPVRFTTLALVLITGAFLVVAVRLTSVQPDTWWALRAGKDMWHTHRVIATDTYSYTAYGHPWPDHAWGYQVLLYAAYALGGLALLTVLHAGLATAAVVLARPRGRVQWADLVVIAPSIALVSLSLSVRPMVLSLLLVALMIRLIHAERWRSIVLLMLVWANLHGEVAVGGLLLVAATAASLVAWLVSWRGEAHTRRRACRRFRAYLLTTTASALATLLNPMGWGLWRYIATANDRPGEKWIAEWQPSWTAPAVTAWFWVWCAVLVVLVLFRAPRLRRWPVFLDLCLVVAAAPLAWSSIRNISVFGVVALPLLVRLSRREGPPRPDTAGSVLPGARLLLALAAVALVVSATRTLSSPTSRTDLGWNPMPASAARAIRACPGHVYTTYNSGAYLIWFTPGVKVFADNRQDPYDAHIMDLSLIGPTTDYAPTFQHYDIRCAALRASDGSALVTLGGLAHWPVVYARDGWVVLAKPGS